MYSFTVEQFIDSLPETTWISSSVCRQFQHGGLWIWTGKHEEWVSLVLRLDSLEITGACLSSKEERVVLYEINREPRDVGGL